MNAAMPGNSEVKSALLIRADHLTERVVDGELVIYDPNRQRVHALNSTAAFVWGALISGQNQPAIVASLCERFPESRESIEQDVAKTLATFTAEGLLST